MTLLVQRDRADDVAIEAILRLKARRHYQHTSVSPPPLRDYIAQAWHVVEPATTYVHGWHIDAICDHLEAVTRGEIRNLLINMPPRSMKSLCVSVFWPTWVWITKPETRWLFSSYAQSLSTRDSLKCRRLIESPWYQRNWGHIYRLTSDQNAKTRYDNDRMGYRLATSVGGSATGEGGDIVVSDDPHNVKEAESEPVRTATLDWWDHVMSTRLNDPKTGAKVIVMQRVHEMDLAGHVLERGGWDLLCLPAEYEGKRYHTSIGWEDPRIEPGELLWPDRFGPAELAVLKRDLGSQASAGQLQQEPAPSEGAIFKRAWWRFYTDRPETMSQVIQSWDMTFKDGDDTDYVVGQVWGKKGADCYLLDQIRARLDFPATVAAVRSLTARWPQATAKLVEDTANGPAIIATLKREIEGLIPVNPSGGKVSRANAVAPLVESGNVYLPAATVFPWAGDFLERCTKFPRVTYDDEIDAMTQALLRLSRPMMAAY